MYENPAIHILGVNFCPVSKKNLIVLALESICSVTATLVV